MGARRKSHRHLQWSCTPRRRYWQSMEAEVICNALSAPAQLCSVGVVLAALVWLSCSPLSRDLACSMPRLLAEIVLSRCVQLCFTVLGYAADNGKVVFAVLLACCSKLRTPTSCMEGET